MKEYGYSLLICGYFMIAQHNYSVLDDGKLVLCSEGERSLALIRHCWTIPSLFVLHVPLGTIKR